MIDAKGEIIPYSAISLPAIKFTTPEDLNFSVSLYPNPVVSKVNLNYTLPSEGKVNVKLFNSNGQLVKEVMNTLQEKGSHLLSIDASDLSSGIYHYRLQFIGDKEYIESGSMIKSK